MKEKLAHDMLYGARAIAKYLGQTERRVRYLEEKNCCRFSG
jgi:hypothetical protein